MVEAIPPSASPSARQILAFELDRYRGVDEIEEQHRRRLAQLVRENEGWWCRETLPGHLTASAFVLSPGLDRILLHHHRKLNRWLQLGGHIEDGQHPAHAALREVHEECGLDELDFYGEPVIFDLDVHTIPARGSEVAHDHLDVRYLLIADPQRPLILNQQESQHLRWWPRDHFLRLLDHEPGAARVAAKLSALATASAVDS